MIDNDLNKEMEIEFAARGLLARVDERTKAIQHDLTFFREELKIMNARNASSIVELKQDIEKKIENIEKNYVKISIFSPIQNVVYGLIGTILLSVLGGILSFIITNPMRYNASATTQQTETIIRK